MLPSSFFYVLLFVVQVYSRCSRVTTSTTLTPPTKPAACTQLPYELFLPLANYPPAENYCSSKYPPGIFTSYYATTVCGIRKRLSPHGYERPQRDHMVPTPTIKAELKHKNRSPIAPRTAGKCDAKCSLFSHLVTNVASAVSTICACIQTQDSTT
jgi:hypothetical protein